MKVVPMAAVECAVLHAQFEPIPADMIFHAAAGIARDLGIEDEVRPMVTSTDKDAHMLIGHLRVLVSQNPQPLEQEGFRSTLALPTTMLAFPDAAKVVAAHRANTFVTVGQGVIDPAGLGDKAAFLQQVAPELSFFLTDQQVERAIRLCSRLSAFIHARHAATAFHWCMNSMILPPKAFLGVAQAERCEMLGVNPVLSSSSGRMGPGEPVAVFAFGSQFMLGRAIRFAEERVPPAYMIERVYQFVAMCRMRGALLPDWDSFGIDENESIHVAWKDADETTPLAYVLLTIVRNKEFGIAKELSPRVVVRYDDAGRVADIDTSRVPEDVRSDPGFADEFAVRRPDILNVPKANVQEMRALAMASSAPPPEKRSFFSRVVGSLTRH